MYGNSLDTCPDLATEAQLTCNPIPRQGGEAHGITFCSYHCMAAVEGLKPQQGDNNKSAPMTKLAGEASRMREHPGTWEQ